MWPGKQYSNSLEDSEGIEGNNLLPTGKGNYLPSARARLQGLKQLSVEKLATLKQKIAETRSRTNFKPGEHFKNVFLWEILNLWSLLS